LFSVSIRLAKVNVVKVSTEMTINTSTNALPRRELDRVVLGEVVMRKE
jgi:hypothetical protein